MRITDIKVRTTYTIQIEAKDRLKIFQAWLEKESNQLLYEDAFGNLTADSTLHEIDSYFDKIQFVSSKTINNYLASCFGFDGWSCGAFLHNEVIRMECYKEGDHIMEGR